MNETEIFLMPERQRRRGGKPRSKIETVVNPRVKRPVCGICRIVGGSAEKLIKGASGVEAHESCIRSRRMWPIVLEARTLMTAIGVRTIPDNRVTTFLDTFRKKTSLANMTCSGMAHILSEMLSEVHGKCVNGRSQYREAIERFALRAGEALLVPVTIKRPG